MQKTANAALAPAWFTWQVPGKPLSVQLSWNFVEQLGAEVVRGFKSIPKPGLEVGGLLLGDTHVHDGAPVVNVHDFEPFPCEYPLGPSYILMDSDLEKLREAVALPKGNEGDLRVVGYYRSQTRNGFAMSTEDHAIMARFFSDPAQLFLLIQPSANGRITAGFFIWENGAIHGEATYLAFPFHNDDLQSGRITVAEEHAALQPLPAETPRVRDFASRRITEEVEPQHAPSHRVAPSTGIRTGRFWVGIAIVLMLAVAALLELQSTRSSIQGPPSLGLHVALEADGFRLTWNRRAPAIRAAMQGVLTITDGGQQRIWNLDSKQLLEGGIVYWAATDDVNFRLQVFQDQHAIGESIRTLGMPLSRGGGRPSSAPSAPAPEKVLTPAMQAPAPMTVSPHRAEAAHSGNNTGVANVRAPTINPAIPPPTPRSPGPYSPNPLTTNRAEEILPSRSRVVRDEPEEIVPARSGTVSNQPEDPFSRVTVEPLSDSRFHRFIGKMPIVRRFRKPPMYVPPRPLHVVPTVVPAELRSGMATPVPIDIKAYVNADGRVDYAEPLSEATGANRNLVSLAVYAARRWEFEPALEGTRKVPAEVILHYVFGATQTAYPE